MDKILFLGVNGRVGDAAVDQVLVFLVIYVDSFNVLESVAYET